LPRLSFDRLANARRAHEQRSPGEVCGSPAFSTDCRGMLNVAATCRYLPRNFEQRHDRRHERRAFTPIADQRMKRRFRRPWRTRLIWLGLAALVIWRLSTAPRPEKVDAPLPSGTCRVERVVDGDTLLLWGGDRVRLIGVDTPETVMPEHPVEPFGREATQFTRSFLAAGEVRLEFDRQRLDRHGRHLAYVWVGERMLNEELLRAGLARFEPEYHYSETVKRRFRRAQDEARAAQRGIWLSGDR